MPGEAAVHATSPSCTWFGSVYTIYWAAIHSSALWAVFGACTGDAGKLSHSLSNNLQGDKQTEKQASISRRWVRSTHSYGGRPMAYMFACAKAHWHTHMHTHAHAHYALKLFEHFVNTHLWSWNSFCWYAQGTQGVRKGGCKQIGLLAKCSRRSSGCDALLIGCRA